MDLRQITEDFSVSPQITPQDVAALRAAGFAAILCNRPDGEGADQPPFATIEAAAQSAGLQAAYVPVVAGQMTDADLHSFATTLAKLPRPVLAYCRSGARAATLWDLHHAKAGDA